MAAMIQDQTRLTRFDAPPPLTVYPGASIMDHLLNEGRFMKRIALLGLVGTAVLSYGAFAQSSAVTPSNPAASQPSTVAPTTTGAPKTDQGKPAEKQKAYTGNTGKKKDAGTACSSARPNANGGVDCGTGGNSATTGKVPK
jgi:hypothetical protein